MVYGWITFMGISTLNLKSVFLASSYMVGLSWLCPTMCFSIRRYEHQSWNDITYNYLQYRRKWWKLCFNQFFLLWTHLKSALLPPTKTGKLFNLFRSREPIGDISLVYLDLMKRKERPKSNLKNGRWDWEIHRLFICTTICTAYFLKGNGNIICDWKIGDMMWFLVIVLFWGGILGYISFFGGFSDCTGRSCWYMLYAAKSGAGTWMRSLYQEELLPHWSRQLGRDHIFIFSDQGMNFFPDRPRMKNWETFWGDGVPFSC